MIEPIWLLILEAVLMSKTYKDAPYRIREKRLGVTDGDESCALCIENKGKPRIFTTGFTAIFFAHELSQLESFLELVEEKDFTVEQREVQGYLGKDVYKDLGYRVSFSSAKSAFEGFYDDERAVYSEPRALKENLLWNLTGSGSEAEANQYRYGRSASSAFFGLPQVSHKRNIFTVVSISKTFESRHPRFGGHGHEIDSASYLLGGVHHCHCDYCEPDEKSSKSRIRSITTELKKAYNGGDYDALEDIASELVRTSTSAQRSSDDIY